MAAVSRWFETPGGVAEALNRYDAIYRDGYDKCVYCGEWQSPDAFEDGLRCKKCAEDQDAKDRFRR